MSENSKLRNFGSNHHYLECIKSAYDFASGELLNLIREKVHFSHLNYLTPSRLCCVCVCERERERERESV